MTITLHTAADLAAAVRDLRPDAVALGIEITADWCRDQMHALDITRYEDVDREVIDAIGDGVEDLAVETRTCAACGTTGPIAEDETDPADDELALDSRGLVIATPGVRDNEYVCGACLNAAEDAAK